LGSSGILNIDVSRLRYDRLLWTPYNSLSRNVPSHPILLKLS
jgi:hypothetical protein